MRHFFQADVTELEDLRAAIENAIDMSGELNVVFGNTPLSGGSPEEWKARYDKFALQIPLRRAGQPENVAAAVAFLASDDARHITGSMLLIDGGQTLQSWSNARDSESFPLDYDPGDLKLNL